MTKYEIATLFASLHSPPLDIQWLEQDSTGPKPGDTVRPRDCHLSNVSIRRAPSHEDSAQSALKQRALEEIGVNCRAVKFRDWSKQFIRGIV